MAVMALVVTGVGAIPEEKAKEASSTSQHSLLIIREAGTSPNPPERKEVAIDYQSL